MSGSVVLQQLRDGRWSWCYQDGKLRLMSNRTYATRALAEEEASAAYPATRMEVEDPEPTETIDEEPRRGLIAFVLMVIAAWRLTRRRSTS